MKKAITVALLLFISLSSSSCMYYASMPKEWRGQRSEAENLEAFNGDYKLSLDNPSVWTGKKYNDLRYFQNTSVSGRWKVVIPGLTSINICATNAGTNVRFFDDEKLVYENFFDKQSVELKNGALELNLKNQFEADGSGFVTICNMPTMTLYKTTNSTMLVRRKETIIGTVFVVIPVIAGANYWFKLEQTNVTANCCK